MEYFISNALKEDIMYGPFKTRERAISFKKKHHIFGDVISIDNDNDEELAWSIRTFYKIKKV